MQLVRPALAAFAACFLLAGAARAEIVKAVFSDPTARYGHGILGDAIEWGNLRVTLSGGKVYQFRLPETQVYEDLEPRLWDVTGDGKPEVVVIHTEVRKGARLMVIGLEKGAPAVVGVTPYIGRTHRWLSPVGAADFDGDGRIEIAYVDRPHLAKVLRIWRLESAKLRHVADIPGLTNHKIGWDVIPGGVRDCGDGPEMITADARWQNVVATGFRDGKAKKRSLGPFKSVASFAPALKCN